MPYQHFTTPLGICAVAWSDQGLTRVLIAEPSLEDITRRLSDNLDQTNEQVPPFVHRAVNTLSAYFAGEDVSMDDTTLDVSRLSPFRSSVYRMLRNVPRGTTTTYGELATRLDKPGAARAIGIAMGENPWPVVVPCHRVLASGGDIGGFSAHGGVRTKRQLLRLEGVQIPAPVIRDLFD
ncbi:MAG: methylated-DNA--[protein]-cysteine S-methyltransferase [Pseudomonadota bacterium]